MNNYAIILAAGKGTRFKTELPKCAFPLLGKPFSSHIIDKLNNTKLFKDLILVVGYKKEVFYDLYEKNVSYTVQHEQLGTANAVESTKDYFKNKKGTVLIVAGDVPLIPEQLTKEFLDFHNKNDNKLTVMTMKLSDPFGYGRIVKDDDGEIKKIVEHKNATNKERLIDEVNAGIYLVDIEILFNALKKIEPNELTKEYYLTDIVEIISKDFKSSSFLIDEPFYASGVNDLAQLEEVEAFLRKEINKNHQLNGVNIIDSNSTIISADTKISIGVTIYPNTIFYGKNEIGQDSKIGPNVEIENVVVGSNVEIKHSVVKNSTIKNNNKIGPFAQLRDNTLVGENNIIGNFVEIKNSKIGNDNFISHHAYIGDATIGSRVNIGSGVVTVNYDGINKFETIIGDDVFIGCNSNLIAPIKINNKVIIAAGSTITENVNENTMAIARSRQINKENYYDKYYDKKKK